MEKDIDAERVRELRAASRWTQEVLAENAGVSLRTVQRVERFGLASYQTRCSIARALGVPLEELKVAKPGKDDVAGVPGEPALRLGAVASVAGVVAFLVVALILLLPGQESSAPESAIEATEGGVPPSTDFRPVPAENDRAPQGMRVERTPFGDRLVPIQEEPGA